MEIHFSADMSREQVQDALASKLTDPLFAAIFYILSSLNQLHRLGYIGKYTSVPEHSEVLFLARRDAGYYLTDAEVKEVLGLSTSWDAREQEKMFKFYKAYHALKWDVNGQQCN